MFDAGFWLKAVVIFIALGYWLVAFGPSPLLGRKKASGDWIAECWLEWEICRGSTLYRQRFKTRFFAKLYAKLFAWILDQRLPFWYTDTDWSGRYKKYHYEFEIHWAVRKIVEGCPHDGLPIWSPYMPGNRQSQSEHRDAHPCLQDYHYGS